MRFSAMRGLFVSGFVALAFVAGPMFSVRAEDAPDKKEPTSQPVVDFKKIKEILPETLGGLKKIKAQGQKIVISPEMTMVTVESRYQKDKDTSEPAHSLDIISYSNAQMAGAAAIWANMEIDKETDDGYEKTEKIDGFPAMIRYNAKDKNADVTIFVANEFLVSFKAEAVSDEELHKLFKELPLKKLAELKAK